MSKSKIITYIMKKEKMKMKIMKNNKAILAWIMK